MTFMFKPGLLLSIIDFIPTILYIIGCYFLLKYAFRNTHIIFWILMLLGVASVSIGGFSKAVWKFNFALSGNDIQTLGNSQVYLLAAGSLLVFISVLSIFMKYNKRTSQLYAVPFFIPVIGILTISTVGYLTLLATICFEKKLMKSALAFIVYLFAAIVMATSSLFVDRAFVHWITESVNILGSGMLIYGAYHLNKYDKAHPVIINT